MSAKRRVRSTLKRKARRGYRGHPIATVAYYGPDDKVATKVAVGIIMHKDGEADPLERWFSEGVDVRLDPSINQQILDFIASHKVRSVAMLDRIIGCPHEEDIDYPKGESCPQCPFWANRDRWTGESIQ